MSYQHALTQDEVDALIAGVTGHADERGRDAGAAGRIQPYDLSSPDRVVRHRMQTLELINERFARRLRSALFNFMRRNADITVATIRVQKYSDFERNLPVPSNLNMVAMKPLRGAALFTFDPNLVFLIIDTLFGGHGRYTTRVEGRDFTLTEQRIIRRLLNLTLDAYGQGWKQVYPIEFEYIRSEMHTKFARISSGNEIVVVSSFHIELGSVGGRLSICLPYSMLEPIRDLLIRPLSDAASDPIDQRWTHQLSRQVYGAEVALSAELACINISLAQMMQLGKGDILPLNIEPVITASLGDVPVMRCTYGSSAQGRYALRVDTLLTQDEYELIKAVNARTP